MNPKTLKEKWLEIVRAANERGIPLPLLRIDGRPTFSGTLAFLSFNIWVFSVIGKIAGTLGGMSPSDCLNMFLACAGLYWGRKFQKDGSKVEIEGKGPSNE